MSPHHHPRTTPARHPTFCLCLGEKKLTKEKPNEISSRGRHHRVRPCSEGQDLGARDAIKDLSLGPGLGQRPGLSTASLLLPGRGWMETSMQEP